MTVGQERVQLGSSRWHTRPECALRSAGFPLALVSRLGDAGMAATADACAQAQAPSAEFSLAYQRAADRLARAVRELANDPRFREAVTWQSPDVVRNCLDKVAAGKPVPGRVWRQYVLTVASYLQRYTTKNDTIGFFGPITWARWRAGAPALTVESGKTLLASRSLYFECWAINAVAAALSRDPCIWPWCVPQLAEDSLLLDAELYGPRGSVVRLEDGELAVARLSDGTRTVHDIVAALAQGSPPGRSAVVDAEAALRSLAARGLLRIDLTGPVEARPEITLRRKLAAIGDPAARARALAAIDELLAARHLVAAAAGDHGRLMVAHEHLAAVFERITGTGAVRRQGQMYAGRTLIFEDTKRDVAVTLGTTLLDAVAEPLSLVLESAQWLAGRAAEIYRARLAARYDRCRARIGSAEVPLALLVSSATPDLAFSARQAPPPVTTLTSEFQQRWASVLRIAPGSRQHSVSPAAITTAVRAAFPARSPQWSAAIHHAPDIMIAADSPEKVCDGEFVCVLGEVHVGVNTLCTRPLVEQHHNAAALLAAEEADHGSRRIFAVPARDARYVNSRTYPPALLSAQYTYWTMHSAITGAPGPVIPVADLIVSRREGELVVRSRRDGREFGLLEMLGEYLSGAIVNSFKLAPPSAHTPRVSIGKLMVMREAWTFSAGELGWCRLRNEQDRYLAARRWRRSHELPERVFFQVPGEDKPVFADLTSIAFVGLLARSVRRCARADPGACVTLTEMVPGSGQTWLHDALGAGYTAEFRLVFTDPRWLASGVPEDARARLG
jgi:hypothetical protein